MKYTRTSYTWTCLVLVALISESPWALGEERRIEGVIKSFDGPQATITIMKEVDGRPRDETFKIQNQAKVTLGGQQTTLNNLAAGQRVTVHCQSPGDIATQVEAFKPVAGRLKLEALEELPNPQFSKSNAYLMPDGLTLYWTELDEGLSFVVPPKINVATRKTPQDKFSNTVQLLRGFDPILTADGLRLIMIRIHPDSNLFECVRKSETAPFESPQKIEELSSYGSLSCPSLSSDGLTLYATKVDSKSLPSTHEALVFRRKSLDAKWGTGQPVRFSGADQTRLRSTIITPDQRYAFSQLWLGGNSFPLLVFRATRDGKGYESPRLLKIGTTVPMNFTATSYHAGTNELFGTELKRDEGNFEFKAVVLRNFDPQALGDPPAEYLRIPD